MPVRLQALDHVTIRTRDLDRSLAFYQGVLGLKPAAWRPPFRFDGAWLALGGQAIVHLVAGRPADDPSGAVDHFAIAGAGSPDAAKAELAARNIAFDERETPDGRFRQLFVTDPDGVKVEIVFDQQPAPPATSTAV